MELFENERIILVNNKNIYAYLPSLVGIALVVAGVLKKVLIPPGLIIYSIPFNTIREYKVINFTEWYLLAGIALLIIYNILWLSWQKVIMTNYRIFIAKSRNKLSYMFALRQCTDAKSGLAGSATLWFGKEKIRLKHFKNIEILLINLRKFHEGLLEEDEFENERNIRKKSILTQNSISEQTEKETNKTSREENKTDREENIPSTEQLKALIGLKPVKDEIIRLENYITVMQQRKKEGLPVSTLTLHTVFEGNPGTGKTTVARIMATIFKEKGVLETGQLIETERSGLIGEYVGQTAVKTNHIVDKAIGGVLFIDEAYTLSEGGQNDYGQEAIATLLKRMEDDRDKFVVILAGYTGNMENFLDSNPGLRSRFTRKIEFPDYNPEEMMEIFLSMCDKHSYILTKEANEAVNEIMLKEARMKSRSSGNGRFVRNLFEVCIQNQANRLSKNTENTIEQLKMLTYEDIHL